MFQDIISWVSGKVKKNRFRYSPALSWLRYGVLAVFVVALVAGAVSLAALIAPYSAYGRIVSNLLTPLYQWGNNVLVLWAERVDSYAFYSVDVWMKGLSTFAVAVGTVIVLFILAWRGGRTYCNTICPVGTVLGFLSRYSYFKPVIDTSKCNGCGLCATKCKAACIHSKEHAIDYSRCVDCFDCLGACKQKALVYAPASKGQQRSSATEKQPVATESSSVAADSSKRRFLLAGLATAGAAPTLLTKAQESIATMEGKKAYKKENPITPPGSVSQKRFQQHCTSCHLCVSK